jgi:N-acyl-D-amino-acid deacylase
MFDLLLKNARIVDGSGNPWIKGDVAVEGNKIVAMGDLGSAAAKRTIDVAGSVVAPGFIDLHSHSDVTFSDFPRGESMITQGITTQLVGNCGMSPFPIVPERIDLLKSYIFFSGPSLSFDWNDAATFMKHLDSLPLSGNVALQVGHGAVRIAAMGYDNRVPTESELAFMKKLVAESFEAGVFGFSSGLIYVPGSYSQTPELVALAEVGQRYGGFYSSHIRGEGQTLLEAVDEALTVGKEAGVGVQLSHHKAAGKNNWGKVKTSLQMIDQARAAGQDVQADQYPYTAGSTTLTALLPQWALEGGVAAMKERLRNPETYARIKASIANQEADSGASQFSIDTIMIGKVADGPFQAYEGKMVTEIAEIRGEDPVDTALLMLRDTPGGIAMIVFIMSEDDIKEVMQHPVVSIGTDGTGINPTAGGKPHPRTYGTFPRVLGKYVRDEKILTLEEAIRKMTSLPARRLGRFDMGLIRPGCQADLVVFDPENVNEGTSYADPHQYARGISHVIVNGQVVIENGQDTGVNAGRVLRRGQA